MFADSFYDSAWANRSHRGWTTLASFGVQALAIAGLLVLPLMYIQGLPELRLTRHELITPPSGPAPAPREGATNASTSNMAERKLISPPQIPKFIVNQNESQATPAPDLPPGSGIPDGTGDSRSLNPVIGSIGNGINAIALPPPPVAHQPRVSVMMEGNLIHRVQPVYPTLAKQARVQGTVVLKAVISREGTIENLQVASGPPILVQAAIDAVRQWRYRPHFLNHEPVEVDTQVTVNFVLSGG